MHRRRRRASAAATGPWPRPVLAEQLRRVVASQELTVEAAIERASATTSLEAMLADPLAGRIDFDQLAQMTDEMLDATRTWLPQFA